MNEPKEIYGRCSGFPCPVCGQDHEAAVVSPDLIHVVELLCPACGWEWAVEVR